MFDGALYCGRFSNGPGSVSAVEYRQVSAKTTTEDIEQELACQLNVGCLGIVSRVPN